MTESTPASEDLWEYGFYDSHPSGNWNEAAEPQADPLIWWYVFNMPHKSAESAAHTGSKSCNGQPVIVRRRPGQTLWEHVTPELSLAAARAQEPAHNQPTSVPERVELLSDGAFAWAAYRKDHQPNPEHLDREAIAFRAGWNAAREGSTTAGSERDAAELRAAIHKAVGDRLAWPSLHWTMRSPELNDAVTDAVMDALNAHSRPRTAPATGNTEVVGP